MMLLSFVLILTQLSTSQSHHILVSNWCGAGHWATPLVISRKLLDEGHFITFVVSESCPARLETIIMNDDKYKYQYQILYGDKSCTVSNNVKKQRSVFDIKDVFYSRSKCLFDPMYFFLALTNEEYLNTTKHALFHQILKANSQQRLEIFENITLNHTDRVDLILSDNYYVLWGVALSKIYEIPVIVRSHPALNDISRFEFKDAPHKAIHRSIKFMYDNYMDKLNNFVYYLPTMIGITLGQKGINQHLEKYGIDSNYNNIAQFHKGSAFYLPLGYPFFSSLQATRPYLKQFGFMVYDNDDDENMIRNQYESLIAWLEMEQYQQHKVMLISMGSSIIMNDIHLESIFDIFSSTNMLHQNHWRVIWALRKTNIDSMENDRLKQKLSDFENKNDYFRIEEWIPQLYLLKTYDTIKIFMTHCGFNGVHEGLYAKKVILGFPHNVDQFYYARRVKELRCAQVIDKRITDPVAFRAHFVEIWLNVTRNIEVYQQHVLYLHHMLHDFHANINNNEVVVWINNILKYGTKPLINHNIYVESDTIHWYQESDIDLFIIVITMVVFLFCAINRCVSNYLHGNRSHVCVLCVSISILLIYRMLLI